MKDVVDLQVYETKLGKAPYIQWEGKLTRETRAILTARLARIRMGNFGDCKAIRGKQDMYELRVHFGPGYRIYFGKKGDKLVLLLLGGDKGSQKRDIDKAYEYWEDYLNNKR